jgi:hypothetical protein
MRLTIAIAFASMLCTSQEVNAAECTWPPNTPTENAYKGIEGRFISATVKNVPIPRFPYHKKVTFDVRFGHGIKDLYFSAWYFAPVPEYKHEQVGDWFIWREDPKIKGVYNPATIHRTANGMCRMHIDPEFAFPAKYIGF